MFCVSTLIKHEKFSKLQATSPKLQGVECGSNGLRSLESTRIQVFGKNGHKFIEVRLNQCKLAAGLPVKVTTSLRLA
jgi:hypothetical protein